MTPEPKEEEQLHASLRDQTLFLSKHADKQVTQQQLNLCLLRGKTLNRFKLLCRDVLHLIHIFIFFIKHALCLWGKAHILLC